jgi:6-phosphogluconolactonase
MPKLLKFTHPDDFVNEITYLIEEKILDAYEKNGLIRIALSGGETPIPIYEKLAQSQVIPWERVEIYLVDERYVPISNLESNQKKIVDILGPTMSFLHGFEAWNTDLSIQESSKKYNLYLESLYDESDFLFDLVILGMGSDGHTASIFPNDRNTLLNEDDLSAFTLNAPNEIKERLTLTYKAILNSDDIYVLLNGDGKIKTLEKALETETNFIEYPIRKIIDEHQNTTIFVLNNEKATDTDK